MGVFTGVSPGSVKLTKGKTFSPKVLENIQQRVLQDMWPGYPSQKILAQETTTEQDTDFRIFKI